ncbi:uncharacterized protein K489DRAFT_11905 [Dissoconium aciculare CBS 342.82]|uniref:Uncharacterized protein n=1 Tax=Dissoconium aciculare CBS 342.82 TaxID=1314786 RepID=A0A6J3MH62_9PEZI|nr:uncharacterized protein K489DRAFT_11905 [Dissoconium aciculare CBS 342.82]KAF1827280.1 hypothetical protein K489DRAFT_11905 [Dissoconium aciculare CBS 342.82]
MARLGGSFSLFPGVCVRAESVSGQSVNLCCMNSNVPPLCRRKTMMERSNLLEVIQRMLGTCFIARIHHHHHHHPSSASSASFYSSSTIRIVVSFGSSPTPCARLIANIRSLLCVVSHHRSPFSSSRLLFYLTTSHAVIIRLSSRLSSSACSLSSSLALYKNSTMGTHIVQ